MKIHALVFSKAEWDRPEAIAWAKAKGYRFDLVEERIDAVVLQQTDEVPGDVAPMAKGFPEGIEALASDAPADEAATPLLDADPKVLALLMQRATPRDDDALIFIKSDFQTVIEKDAADNGRLRYRITTDAEDRMGDVVDPTGWMFKNYRKNPIVLFNHEYGEVAGSPPAQGRSLEIEKTDNGLLSVVEFHRKTRFNNELYQLARDGYMNSASVGFLPLARPEEREAKDGRHGLHFKKQDLLEWSIVAVPANPEAFQMAAKKGVIRHKTVEYLQSLASFAAGTGSKGPDGESLHQAARERAQSNRIQRAAISVNARLRFLNARMGR